MESSRDFRRRRQLLAVLSGDHQAGVQPALLASRSQTFASSTHWGPSRLSASLSRSTAMSRCRRFGNCGKTRTIDSNSSEMSHGGRVPDQGPRPSVMESCRLGEARRRRPIARGCCTRYTRGSSACAFCKLDAAVARSSTRSLNAVSLVSTNSQGRGGPWAVAHRTRRGSWRSEPIASF